MSTWTVDDADALPDGERYVCALHDLDFLAGVKLDSDLHGLRAGHALLDRVADDASAAADPRWYDLLGHPFDSRPTQPGVYIHQGKKVVVK